MALPHGTRIGPYEIRGLLGAGGMGEVYTAHDARLGRDVAIKTLPAALVADAASAARFDREARLLATLNHPNIATVHGVEHDGGHLAIVMELVEGETLYDRLRRAGGRGLGVSGSLRIAGQLVAALDAAHERGIVHRDLKPANIKLTGDGLVKVLDFGLARTFADDTPPGERTVELHPPITEAGSVVGTPAYMSPEQARGEPVDRRTDIWAFGCVLYEMLAGQAPFARATPADTLAAVLGAPVDPAALPGDVPDGVRRLIGLCLERSPRARLRDIADARVFLETRGTVAATERRWSRRAVVGAGLAALAGLAAGWGGARLTSGAAATAADPARYQRLTFRRGIVRTARFAPDGRTVLYGALWDGDVCRTYAVRPDSPESAALPLPPAMPLAVSSQGELALALGTHFRGVMTYGTLARVPLAGGAPRALQEDVKYADWSPDGRELAIVRRDGDRDRLEYPPGTPIAAPASGGFSFPRLSPDGEAIAVYELSSPGSLVGRVVVFGSDGRRLAATKASYFNVFGLAWRGGEIWFTAADERPLFRNTVYAMVPGGEARVLARTPGNTTLHDIAPDGRALIARTDDRAGFAVAEPGAGGARDLSWLDASDLADLSADGSQLLISESGVGGGPDGSVYLRAVDGGPAVRLGDGYARALSPDGRWALVAPGGGQPYLELVPTGAGQTRRIERAGLHLGDARFLADGRRVVVRARAGDAPSRLVVLDLEGDGVRAVTPDTLAVTAYAWAVAPDGSRVAVDTPEGIRLFALADGAPSALPGTDADESVVGWIVSGVLVARLADADGRVFVVDPATGARAAWAVVSPAEPAAVMTLDLRSLVVTPDGRRYGYSWHRANSDLYLVEGWGSSPV